MATPAQLPLPQPAPVRLALPKGRMQQGVLDLLAAAGVQIETRARGYRPHVPLAGFEAKFLKPQNIVEMLAHGSRDVGFAGADWVAELGAELVALIDTGLDPVRLVAAAPRALLADPQWRDRPLIVASEYERLTRRWIARQGLDARCVRTYGATEVFPPEDADLIVDNTATGSTLAANDLQVIDTLMDSATGLYAHPAALADPGRRERIERLVVLLDSVLAARSRALVEVNVPTDCLEAVIAALPCMREPTLAPLHGGGGFAVKAAVPRQRLAEVIPEIKARGGTDVLVTAAEQIVP